MNEKLIKYNFPEDLRKMNYEQLDLLSYEIREFLVSSVSKTGGHLSSNLGAVELTIALHRSFNTPEDKLIWDVGHQTYVHKILTGRANGFKTLRSFGGMSGFPKVSESEYDLFDTGHGSNSISLGLGMAAARQLKDERYSIVSIIGDGAMTGGLAFEAMNNASNLKCNFIVVLNDNGMSISPNTGGLSKSLGRITSTDKYLHLKEHIKKGLLKVPGIGESMISGIHHAKANIKYVVIDGIFFEELGFKYLGPVDGHNIKELCETLERAKKINGPVLVHCVTTKGKGYSVAEKNANLFHGIGPFDIETGRPIKKNSGSTFSSVFGRTICRLASDNKDIVAISAAMVDGVGLSEFKTKYSSRLFDVGIAEEHAVSFAAGLARSGLKPFVAIYSTFLQRAYDEILEDLCLQNLPVVLCLDRAGVVGADGETHHGIFDISYLRNMPGLTFMAPKDGEELEKMIEYAYRAETPCAIRYPKGEANSIHLNSITKDSCNTISTCSDIKHGKSQRISPSGGVDIWAVGNMVKTACTAADILKESGIAAGVVNMRFIRPLDTDELLRSSADNSIIAVIEDGIADGGIGEAIRSFLADKDTKVICFGWPDKFIEHGSTDQLYRAYGLDAESIADNILSEVNS